MGTKLLRELQGRRADVILGRGGCPPCHQGCGAAPVLHARQEEDS
jgi:hypothetical protein